VTTQADIIVTALGQARFLKADMGSRRRHGGGRRHQPDGRRKLVGDVDYDAVKELPGLSLQCGRVGPMTITMLLHNTLEAAILQHG